METLLATARSSVSLSETSRMKLQFSLAELGIGCTVILLTIGLEFQFQLFSKLIDVVPMQAGIIGLPTSLFVATCLLAIPRLKPDPNTDLQWLRSISRWTILGLIIFTMGMLTSLIGRWEGRGQFSGMANAINYCQAGGPLAIGTTASIWVLKLTGANRLVLLPIYLLLLGFNIFLVLLD